MSPLPCSQFPVSFSPVPVSLSPFPALSGHIPIQVARIRPPHRALTTSQHRVRIQPKSHIRVSPPILHVVTRSKTFPRKVGNLILPNPIRLQPLASRPVPLRRLVLRRRRSCAIPRPIRQHLPA